MKRLAHPLILVFALLWSVSLHAAVIVFEATLSGAEEVPPNASPGTGSATLALDTTALTLSVDVDFDGLLAPTIAAHLHCCTPPGANAPVVVPFAPGFPLGVMSGGFFDVFVLPDLALLPSLLAGLTYVNVHTTTFPGGEIRGQVHPVPVPEPATLALLAVAALAGGLARRRVV